MKFIQQKNKLINKINAPSSKHSIKYWKYYIHIIYRKSRIYYKLIYFILINVIPNILLVITGPYIILHVFNNEMHDTIKITNIGFAVLVGFSGICFSWARTLDSEKDKLNISKIILIGEMSFQCAILFLLASGIKYSSMNLIHYEFLKKGTLLYEILHFSLLFTYFITFFISFSILLRILRYSGTILFERIIKGKMVVKGNLNIFEYKLSIIKMLSELYIITFFDINHTNDTRKEQIRILSKISKIMDKYDLNLKILRLYYSDEKYFNCVDNMYKYLIERVVIIIGYLVSIYEIDNNKDMINQVKNLSKFDLSKQHLESLSNLGSSYKNVVEDFNKTFKDIKEEFSKNGDKYFVHVWPIINSD